MPIRFLYLKVKMSAGKWAQSVYYLLCKCEDPELVLKKINGHMWWLMLVFPALVKKGQRNPRVCWPASLANLLDSRPIRDPIFQTHKVVGT